MSKPIYFPKSQDSDDMQDHETALSCVSLALQVFGETESGEQEPHEVFRQADRRSEG